MPTIALLVGLMVVSAQLRLAGFYGLVTRRLAERELTPDALLAVLVAVVGVLSAVLVNDIVCLAMAPVLVEVCARRRLDPVPFLLALACAANVGSAATLIGNPQNMLIGQALHLPFAGYLRDASVPTVLGLVVVWWVIRTATRGRWQRVAARPGRAGCALPALAGDQGPAGARRAWCCSSSLTPWPREVVALGAAGVLLVSRSTASRDTLGLVDGQLLLLFIGLFVVNHALATTGLPARVLAGPGGERHRPARAGLAVRLDRAAVEPGLERAGRDAAAAGRDAPAGGTDAGAREHARRQPAHRRQHRQHHRGRAGRRASA